MSGILTFLFSKRSANGVSKQSTINSPGENAGLFHIDLDSARDKSYLTHNLHPYPAKFIPQIPAAIMDEFAPPRAVVVDPFCGSGTVAVEAAIRGFTCHASDLNPIATLVTKAKVSILTQEEHDLLSSLLVRLRMRKVDIIHPIPEFKNRNHWFCQEMAQELNTIRNAIVTLPESGARDVATAVFSAIVVKCSRQESDTRWKAVEKDFYPGLAFQSFESKLLDSQRRLLEFKEKATGTTTVVESDARHMSHLVSASADLVVTSPPYLNSYDYYLYHKLRMFWLGFDHYAVQAIEIGSRNRHSDNAESADSYFEAMTSVFLELRRVLKPNAIAAFVVGDSIHRGNLIDMGAGYRTIAGASGFRLKTDFTYDQRRYTTAFTRGYKTAPKKTHVLIFEKV